MSRYDLGMSLDYCSQWGIVEAVREFFQNCYDASIVNKDNKMFWSYDEESHVLRVGNRDGKLETASLLLGMSSKRDDSKTIGQHGEGYKVATVVLMRLGKSVKVYNRHKKEEWTAKKVSSRRYKTDIVVFDVEKRPLIGSVPDYDLIFEIGGVTEEEYASIVESNLHLQELTEGVDYIKVGDSRILIGEKFAGRLFVGGLFVCKSKVAVMGYDFEPCLVKLDRDRRLVDSIDLQFICGKLICKTNDASFIYKMREVWDGAYLRYYLRSSSNSVAEEIYDREYSSFCKTHGVDAVPVTTMAEFNRLTKNGYNAVMVSDNAYNFITNASGYVEADGTGGIDECELADKLEEWFKKHIAEGTDAYKEGSKLIEDILYVLRDE